VWQHYRAGNKFLLEGQDLHAVQEYTASIQFNPAYEDAYYNRGIAYLNTGVNAKLAITDFTQVLKMNPTCASAYNNRGISYKQEGKVELAIADYRACLKLEPQDEYAAKNVELCEQELAAQGKRVTAPLGHDYSGYVYRQTPAHYFAKRFLSLHGGMLSDTMEDSVLKGFHASVKEIRCVMPQFDEPYCSTAPECEFQVMFGRQVVRIRAPSAQARAEWIEALGGVR
jgi:tetratricopeptide (TPR) repeat protein